MVSSENYVGKTTTAKNGMKMTVIAHRSYDDIDVMFEDGVIAKHRSFGAFKVGAVKHPIKTESSYILRKAKEYIGMRKTARNGMEMEIIDYHGAHNISVRFVDGTIVDNVSMQAFKAGRVKNLNLENPLLIQARKSHLGERGIARNGLGMEIIAWNNTHDISVKFDDGAIVDHKYYGNFVMGFIQHPEMTKNEVTAKTKLKANAFKRVGEQVTNKNGEILTLIAYYNANSVDIQFPDGTVVNRQYHKFKSGNVIKKSLPKDNRDKTGEERYSGAGIKMKIVAYKSAKSIEVEFEDGSRRNGISYGQFTLGDILHPKFRKNKLSNNWEVGNYIVTGLAYIASDGHGEFYCRNKETDETDILSLKEIMGR